MENDPIWRLLENCAQDLTRQGVEPFTRSDLISCVQKQRPGSDADSINPIIQGITSNRKGGASGADGKRLFYSVGRGKFILYSRRNRFSSGQDPKISRKSETLVIDQLAVGLAYSRNDVQILGGVAELVNTREWTGIVEFKNCIVLFSTLDKSQLAAPYQYNDYFAEGSFFWESQGRNTQSSPSIERIIAEACPILLFVREVAKVKGVTQPFIYFGTISPLDYDGNKPVTFQYELNEIPDNAPEPIRHLINWRKGEKRPLKPIELPDRKPSKPKGQGRQHDTAKKKAVELRAMKVAEEYYLSLGYQVEDTSYNRPYDFECNDGSDRVRVEVKGLTGKLGDVMVSANEVVDARSDECRTDLFVVHSIVINEVESKTYEGEGGERYIEENWVPDESRLEPTQFRYSIQSV